MLAVVSPAGALYQLGRNECRLIQSSAYPLVRAEVAELGWPTEVGASVVCGIVLSKKVATLCGRLSEVGAARASAGWSGKGDRISQDMAARCALLFFAWYSVQMRKGPINLQHLRKPH